MSLRKPVFSWTCANVRTWLKNNGFQSYIKLFCVIHKIDGQALLYITEEDLKGPPLNLTILGDVKRLTIGIHKLRGQSFVGNNSLAFQGVQGRICDISQSSLIRKPINSSKRSPVGIHQYCNGYNDFENSSNTSQDGIVHIPKFEPEVFKTVISYIYVSLVFFLTAFVMVVVHDRLPDVEKYPPLPDIVLDNLPYMPWAFMASELCGIILSVILLTVIFLHKHKFIVLRRLFAITGTVFLLRCITMFVTSLSVPDPRLQCSGKMYGDLDVKIKRAIEICTGFGMTLTGVRTCGDYMFSGHTIVITMLNHFITEYSPRDFHLLHTLSWILNIFGTFFILAAHEHYSIDVIIAFYITSRLFLYYHTLANSQALHRIDERTKIWFPMFSFFESNIEGIVPNEFAWPLPVPSFVTDYISEVIE